MSNNYCDEITYLKLKKRLSSLGEMHFTIASDSMHPLIKVGDEITVLPIENEIQIFDIIVFWTGTKLISHYVWHFNQLNIKSAPSLTTRSLKNPYESDDPIMMTDILGTVALKKISLFTRTVILLKCLIFKQM